MTLGIDVADDGDLQIVARENPPRIDSQIVDRDLRHQFQRAVTGRP